MAIVARSGQPKQFYLIVPGVAGVKLATAISEPDVWEHQIVSGEYKTIAEVDYALYRHSGSLYLRMGKDEFCVTLPLRCDHDISRLTSTLIVWVANVKYWVEESIPQWLAQSPMVDEMVLEEQLWTVRAYSVLSQANGQQFFWPKAGW